MAAVLPTGWMRGLRYHVDHYDQQGYTSLPVLAADEVKRIRTAIFNYTRSGGRLVRRKGLGVGGYFIPGFHNDVALKWIAQLIDSKPNVHALLRHVAGDHRLLSRNEIYVSRAGAWHADTMSRFSGVDILPPGIDEWSRLPDGEVYNVITVTLYLQDHAADHRGLGVQRGSHRLGRDQLLRSMSKGERHPTFVGLNTSIGDAAIFNSRLSHRGQPGSPSSGSERTARISVAMQYGRVNVFSEAHDRCYALRNKLLDQDLCGGHPWNRPRQKNCTAPLIAQAKRGLRWPKGVSADTWR